MTKLQPKTDEALDARTPASNALIEQIIAAWHEATDEGGQQALDLLRRNADRGRSEPPQIVVT